MSTVVITANVTGTADEEDRRAMKLLINQENDRRASLDPPGEPLLQSTAAERRASYEALLAPLLAGAHASYIQQAGERVLLSDLKPLWQSATDAKRAAALAALQ